MKILEEQEILIAKIFTPVSVDNKRSKKTNDLFLHAISMLLYAMIFYLLLTNL